MARKLNLVSGDSHINEPPDLWQSRVPAKFQDRAPRMERFEKGDAWVMEGSPVPINFGNNVNGGMPPEERSPWVRWEDARKGGAVPAIRLEEQDADGVDAEVLYPTPRISMNVFVTNKDSEFHVACIRAYNDWLSEYAGFAPDRLIGIAMMPHRRRRRRPRGDAPRPRLARHARRPARPLSLGRDDSLTRGRRLLGRRPGDGHPASDPRLARQGARQRPRP